MFTELRQKLDEAITYGTIEQAWQLAEQGLRQSQEKELPAETEYFKGQIQILSGNYERAIDCFDRAVQYNPHDGAAFNDRALCMIELGTIDAAFEYFDKGIEVEPDYATVYHNKGWLLNKIGRYGEAIEYFQKALELEPLRPVTYEGLGNALINLSDHAAAKQVYEKALSLLKEEYADIKEQIITEIKLLENKIK